MSASIISGYHHHKSNDSSLDNLRFNMKMCKVHWNGAARTQGWAVLHCLSSILEKEPTKQTRNKAQKGFLKVVMSGGMQCLRGNGAKQWIKEHGSQRHCETPPILTSEATPQSLLFCRATHLHFQMIPNARMPQPLTQTCH
ncbi:hypothetical protein AV530_018877 [Patagioenas fasciata monilis]|uniref:Uncharacterized protein n=1 Tax=Patagioenas fasciata monilis TaxID=372326 RepID=A0A1V4JK92_PATFA|nr:hypothetical protein AV530_018877 [Patagioenas fasciata monilis]